MTRKRRPSSVLITPEICRRMYKLLAETEPFASWNMPDAEDVLFTVNRSRDTSGHFKEWSTGENEIGVSSRCVSTLYTLSMIMGHEMVHLHQRVVKPRTDSPKAAHNTAFKRLSDDVCGVHHWDRHMFGDID